jgi:hypothetical protein
MQSYDYRPNAGKMVLAIVFFAVCAGVGYLATTDNKALLIDGVIYLTPDQAKIFWWVITGLSVAMSLGGVLGLIQAMIGDQRLKLTDEAVTLPKSAFGWATVTIPYHDIVALGITAVRNQRFLRIKTARKTYTIMESRLNRQSFETVCRLIAQGREQARR